MGIVNGLQGNITLPSGFSIHTEGWVVNAEHLVDIITAISDSWQKRSIVLIDWSGAAVGKMLDNSRIAPAALYAATPDFAAAEGTVTLTAKTGVTLSGLVVVTGFSLARDRPTSAAELHFAGNGPLTLVVP